MFVCLFVFYWSFLAVVVVVVVVVVRFRQFVFVAGFALSVMYGSLTGKITAYSDCYLRIKWLTLKT